jgi:adenylate kinase family enzyme
MEAVADLVVVTGPPGAGKSTVAQALSSMFEPSALVAGDEFFAMIDRGFIDPWTEAAHRQNEIVVASAAAAAGRLAAGGYTVIYDGVIGPWFLETFASATALSEIHYVILLPPEDVCLQRVQARTRHSFNDLDATRHMHREFVDSRTDMHRVITTTAEAETIASTVADLFRSGALRWPVPTPSGATR